MTTDKEQLPEESADIVQKDEECLIAVPDGATEPTRTQPKRKYGEKTVTGIIVGQGDLSGSLLMYDFTQRSWGFLGSQPSDNIALDAESFDGNPLIPETTIRVILHAVGTPPTDINDVKYGISTGDKQRGIMYCDTTPGSEDVYIYA